LKQPPKKECLVAHWSSALALKMNRIKRSTEAVRCKNASVGEHFTLEEESARAVIDKVDVRMSS